MDLGHTLQGQLNHFHLCPTQIDGESRHRRLMCWGELQVLRGVTEVKLKGVLRELASEELQFLLNASRNLYLLSELLDGDGLGI